MTERGLCKPDSGGRFLLVAAGMLAGVAPFALGQAGASAPQDKDAATRLPSFEVSTVKPNKSGEGGTRIEFTSDGVSLSGLSLQRLLRETFGMEDDRILGAPAWVKTDRFDIEAKVEASDVPKLEDLTFAQRRQMLLPVLEDRFNLKFHHESRELATYALVIDKGGLKMKEAKPGDTYPNGMKGPDGQGHAGSMRAGRGQITGQGVPVATLIEMLAFQHMGRTIFDKTGLTGEYDFELKWTPDDAPAPKGMNSGGGQLLNGNPAPPDASGPSLFKALQEQLGLKLESQKGPIDVIVIDPIEMPSEN